MHMLKLFILFTWTINLFQDFIVLARDYGLERNQVELGETIGQGQFGDVHKGSCRIRTASGETVIPVAVKTCKADADLAMAEKFLEEACKW